MSEDDEQVMWTVLGRLRALRGGRELALGAPQQRAVLAILLVKHGRLVTRGEIINGVWGDDAPETAANLVQTYVARLRRILEPSRARRAPGQVLVSAGQGYLVHVGPGQLDLAEFDDLIVRARQEAASDNPTGADSLLRTAMDLWQGDAFGDVPGPFAAAQRARLSERLLTVREEGFEAGLALGQHGNLVADLAGLVADHPLRERLRALLMRALYRSGRQVEALAVFQDARRYLTEELGLEPGPELREIQRTILEGTPGASARGPVRVVPAQLPHDGCDFVGRQAELDGLDALLANHDAAGGVIIAVTGQPGVGKTSVAVRWARRISSGYPDGQLYLDLRAFTVGAAPLSAEDAVSRLLHGLGLSATEVPVTLEDRAALYRTLISERRMVVVLDNAPSAWFVRLLLPGTPSCVVVVTSRNRLDGLVAHDGARPVALGLLGRDASVDVLRRVIGDDRVGADLDSARRLIDLAGRLPLALRIAAARLAAHPERSIAELVAELEDKRHRLSALATDDGDVTIRAALDVSYGHLGADAAQLLALLGLVPGPSFTSHLAEALTGSDPDGVRSALTALLSAHLLTEAQPGRYALHDLVRLYVWDLALTEPERRSATHRMLDFYVDMAVRGCARLSPATTFRALHLAHPPVRPQPLRTYDEAIVCLDAERESLLAAMRWAADHGWDEHTWQLPYASFSYFKFRDHAGEHVQAHERALEATRRLGDCDAEQRTLGNLSLTLTLLQDFDHAIVLARQLLDMLANNANRDLEFRTLCNLGYMLQRADREVEALGCLHRALAITATVDNLAARAHILANLGDCHRTLGQHDEALDRMRQALRLNSEIGEHREEAVVHNSMGELHLELGRYAEALSAFRQAEQISAELAAPGQQIDALNGIGHVYARTGDHMAAREAWTGALDLAGDTDAGRAGDLRASGDRLTARGTSTGHSPGNSRI